MQEDLMLGPSMVTHTDLSGWSFGSNFSTTGLLSGLPDNNVITGLESWVPSTPNLISLSGMLMGCDATLSDSINGWDTSNVLDFSNAFQGYMRGRDLPDVSNWKFGSATDISGMFRDCGVVTWDLGHMDVSNVVEMGYFLGSKSVGLIEQDFSCWDVEKISEEPRGWWGLEDLVVMPLWGIAMSDLENRSHVSCRLPAPPVTRPLTFKVGTKEGVDTELTTALEITGSGKTTVKWGDGNHTNITGTGIVEHTYSDLTVKDLEVHGSEITRVELKESKCQVTEINSFGMIGLESLELSPGTVNVTYTVIPTSSPDTITDLSGFCRGMSGLTGTEFQDWDFSHLEDLTGFFSGTTASTINIDGKTFGRLTAADQMFANISTSTITVNNCMFTELVTASQLLVGPIGNTIKLTSLTFSKLEHAGYWLAGGDHTTLLVDGVKMPALTTEKSLFGETNDCQFTVGTWSTPVLTSSHRTFASYASADPSSAKGVTVTGWDMSSITSLNMTFCGHSDCVISVDLSTCNVASARMVFYESTNVTIVGNDLTIREGGSLTDMLQSSKGTLDITIQNWTLEDKATSYNAFGGMSAESGALNFSGLTVGDNCKIDRACAFTTNLAITADDVTFGNGCALASSFAYMYSGISLHAHNWTIGDGCDLTHMLSFHKSTDVDALQWTIGNGCTLTNFAAYYDGTEKPGVRKFNSFTIGTGVTVGIDEMLFAFGEQETLQTRDWTWGNEHIVVNMYSWRVGGSVDATGMSWGTGTQLTRLCNFSTVERIDLTDWTFESVSTDYLLSYIPDTTEVVGVNDWDVANIASLKGYVAHSNFTGLDVSNYDVSNCLDFTETFFIFRPMEDLVDFSTWNLSSGELFTSFAGNSGPIKFDMGHLQVHNATNMDMMFAGQTEVITNQDLTCWNVEKIPTQPPGWEQQVIEGGNRLPLWGQANTDLTGRTHATCALPAS